MARKNATGLPLFPAKSLLPLLAGIFALPGCSSLPGLENGEITLAPVANLLKPEGKVKMDDGVTSNGANKLGRDLKLSDRETDPALTLFFGDGFSGFEIDYLSEFLPKKLDDDAVRELVRSAIRELGVENPKMSGKVMGHIMKSHRDEVDAAVVKRIVGEELG